MVLPPHSSRKITGTRRSEGAPGRNFQPATAVIAERSSAGYPEVDRTETSRTRPWPSRRTRMRTVPDSPFLREASG